MVFQRPLLAELGRFPQHSRSSAQKFSAPHDRLASPEADAGEFVAGLAAKPKGLVQFLVKASEEAF